MSIHNFYLAAGLILWLYILFCLYLRLAVDRRHMKLRPQKMKLISLFFSGACSPERRNKLFPKLLRMSEDTVLFQHICDRFAAYFPCCTPEERTDLRYCMRRILHDRIDALASGDSLGRHLLLHSIFQCRISSRKIDQFLLDCPQTPLSELPDDTSRTPVSAAGSHLKAVQ